jgi:hypothetical protein
MKNRKAHEKQERTRKTGKDVKNRKGYEKQEKIRKHLKMFSICVKLLLLLLLKLSIKSHTRILLQMSRDLQQKYYKENLYIYSNMNIAVREKNATRRFRALVK